MKQSKRMSLAESLFNVAVGFGVAIGAQLIIFPIFNIHIAFKDDLLIGALFTVVSIVRSFALRRLFEAIRVRGIQ